VNGSTENVVYMLLSREIKEGCNSSPSVFIDLSMSLNCLLSFTLFTMKGLTFLVLLSGSVAAGAGAWTYLKSDKDEKAKVNTSVAMHIRNGRIKLAELIKPEDEKKPEKAKSTRKPRAKKTTAKAAKQNVVVVPDFIADRSEDASEEVAY